MSSAQFMVCGRCGKKDHHYSQCLAQVNDVPLVNVEIHCPSQPIIPGNTRWLDLDSFKRGLGLWNQHMGRWVEGFGDFLSQVEEMSLYFDATGSEVNPWSTGFQVTFTVPDTSEALEIAERITANPPDLNVFPSSSHVRTNNNGSIKAINSRAIHLINRNTNSNGHMDNNEQISTQDPIQGTGGVQVTSDSSQPEFSAPSRPPSHAVAQNTGLVSNETGRRTFQEVRAPQRRASGRMIASRRGHSQPAPSSESPSTRADSSLSRPMFDVDMSMEQDPISNYNKEFSVGGSMNGSVSRNTQIQVETEERTFEDRAVHSLPSPGTGFETRYEPYGNDQAAFRHKSNFPHGTGLGNSGSVHEGFSANNTPDTPTANNHQGTSEEANNSTSPRNDQGTIEKRKRKKRAFSGPKN